MILKYPGNFARFYDLIYHSQREGIDNDFYQKEIQDAKGKVLEIGSGTGRLFVPALDNGADIYGIDISPSMTEVLLSKLPENERFRISIGNMLYFSFDFKFDLIIAPFRVMSHLIEKTDQIRAINNVFDHLNEGGRLIFDAFVPDLNQLLNGIDHFTDFEGEYEAGKMIKRIVSTKPDLVNQIIEIHFRLEWEEDEELKSDDWKLPFRFFFRYELEHLIERSKFGHYTIIGDYEGNELNRQSREFVVICQK